MPTKELYKKYEGNQTKDKVVESSAGGLFEGEHWSEEYAKTLTWEKPSQDEINAMAAASHKPITSYEDMPEHIKDKPSHDSYYLTPNVQYLEMVKAMNRELGEQDD